MQAGDRVEIQFNAPSQEELDSYARQKKPHPYQTKPDMGVILGPHLPSDKRFQGSPPSYLVEVRQRLTDDDGELLGITRRQRVIPETKLKVVGRIRADYEPILNRDEVNAMAGIGPLAASDE